MAARFAGPRGLGVGATLLVTVGDRAVPFNIRGLLGTRGRRAVLDGHFVLMDIAAAQQALDRFGRVDRVEIRLADDSEHGRRGVGHRGARLPAGLYGAAAGAARANRSSGCWPRFTST